eukprot:scaffold574_cov246-Pinguiococcus_pyrenoidosus.AAC.23
MSVLHIAFDDFLRRRLCPPVRLCPNRQFFRRENPSFVPGKTPPQSAAGEHEPHPLLPQGALPGAGAWRGCGSCGEAAPCCRRLVGEGLLRAAAGGSSRSPHVGGAECCIRRCAQGGTRPRRGRCCRGRGERGLTLRFPALGSPTRSASSTLGRARPRCIGVRRAARMRKGAEVLEEPCASAFRRRAFDTQLTPALTSERKPLQPPRPRPRVDVMLAMPRPQILKWLFPVFTQVRRKRLRRKSCSRKGSCEPKRNPSSSRWVSAGLL